LESKIINSKELFDRARTYGIGLLELRRNSWGASGKPRVSRK
jgi:hypothetical protein